MRRKSLPSSLEASPKWRKRWRAEKVVDWRVLEPPSQSWEREPTKDSRAVFRSTGYEEKKSGKH